MLEYGRRNIALLNHCTYGTTSLMTTNHICNRPVILPECTSAAESDPNDKVAELTLLISADSWEDIGLHHNNLTMDVVNGIDTEKNYTKKNSENC